MRTSAEADRLPGNPAGRAGVPGRASSAAARISTPAKFRDATAAPASEAQVTDLILFVTGVLVAAFAPQAVVADLVAASGGQLI